MRVQNRRSHSATAALAAMAGVGGDTDTLGCIAGAVAEVRHGVPAAIAQRARSYLTGDLEAVLTRFEAVLQRSS